MNNNNETLSSALEVIDEFNKDTSVMLKILKGILISEYGYEDISGSVVCRENSASLDSAVRWTPPYLSFSLRKEEEYISITITIKEYWNHFKPKKEFLVYGVKFHGVIEPHKSLFWLGKDTVESPDENYKKTVNVGYIEVVNPYHFGSCKFIKKNLWDMKDKQAVEDFAEQVDSL